MSSGEACGRQRARGRRGLEQRGVVLGRTSHRRDAQAVAREQRQRVGRVDVDEVVAEVDAGGDEVVAQPTVVRGIAEARHRDLRPITRRDAQRGRAVVREPDVAVASVGERHAQARDGHAAETARGVEDRADLHAAESEPGVGADDPRPHHDDRGVGVRDVARHRERGEHRHRLVVAAERVAAGDRWRRSGPWRGASATRSDIASGRPAPSVIT